MIKFKQVTCCFYLALVSIPWVAMVLTIRYQRKLKKISMTSKRSKWDIGDVDSSENEKSAKFERAQNMGKYSLSTINTKSPLEKINTLDFEKKPSTNSKKSPLGNYQGDNAMDQSSRKNHHEQGNKVEYETVDFRTIKKFDEQNNSNMSSDNNPPQNDNFQGVSEKTCSDLGTSQDNEQGENRNQKNNANEFNPEKDTEQINTIGINLDIKQRNTQVNHPKTSIYENYLNYVGNTANPNSDRENITKNSTNKAKNSKEKPTNNGHHVVKITDKGTSIQEYIKKQSGKSPVLNHIDVNPDQLNIEKNAKQDFTALDAEIIGGYKEDKIKQQYLPKTDVKPKKGKKKHGEHKNTDQTDENDTSSDRN